MLKIEFLNEKLKRAYVRHDEVNNEENCQFFLKINTDNECYYIKYTFKNNYCRLSKFCYNKEYKFFTDESFTKNSDLTLSVIKIGDKLECLIDEKLDKEYLQNPGFTMINFECEF